MPSCHGGAEKSDAKVHLSDTYASRIAQDKRNAFQDSILGGDRVSISSDAYLLFEKASVQGESINDQEMIEKYLHALNERISSEWGYYVTDENINGKETKDALVDFFTGYIEIDYNIASQKADLCLDCGRCRTGDTS